MTTADYALAISLCSLLIALSSFVWNVWSKFIFPKPRVNASVRIFSMFTADVGASNPHVALNFTNHGPGEVTLHVVCLLYKKHLWSKPEHAMLNPIHNFPFEPYQSLGPFSGGLPKKLLVGEGHTFRFPYEAESFLALPIFRIGATDTFGRYHWVKVSNLRHAQRQFWKDFPNAKKRTWDDPPDSPESSDS